MIRQRKIENAANDLCSRMEDQGQKTAAMYGFIQGAKFADEHPNWIHVSDNLPEDGQVVLVTTPRGNVRMYVYEGGKFIDFIKAESEVSYWMPMPKPAGGHVGTKPSKVSDCDNDPRGYDKEGGER